MKTTNVSRRDFVKQSVGVTAPAMLAATAFGAADPQSGAARQLKIVCVGGHPDDPESGCAGTLLRYSESGHAVRQVSRRKAKCFDAENAQRSTE